MIGPPASTGEALARLLEEFGCHLQVALGGPDIDVAEVGCQLRQQPLDVLAQSDTRPRPGARRQCGAGRAGAADDSRRQGNLSPPPVGRAGTAG